MSIKKLVSLCLITMIGFMSKVYAVTAWTLKGQVGGHIPNKWTEVSGSYSIFNTISLVNSYLWFSVGFICFLFMIINGFKLIIAHGNEKRTKEAVSALRKSTIGLAVCLLAYIIVNLAVRLFS